MKYFTLTSLSTAGQKKLYTDIVKSGATHSATTQREVLRAVIALTLKKNKAVTITVEGESITISKLPLRNNQLQLNS